MRAIKFRAWNKEKSVMVYGDEDNEADYWDGAVATDVQMVNSCLNDPLDISEYLWMQFTGLLDKNGTEIYEGDCLGEIFGSLYVAWCQRCVAFALVNKEFGCFACEGEVNWCEVISHDNLIVIGNIHENPELLK